MSPSTCLDLDSYRKNIDENIYRIIIGSLLYLTARWPNIMFSIYKCERFQSAPKESHLNAIKRIICYLLGTQDIEIWYPHFSRFDLIRYSDVDFADNKNDWKCTSGTYQILVMP